MGQLGKTPLQAEKSSWEWQVIYSNPSTKLFMLIVHPRSPEHFSVCPRANPTCMLPTPLLSHRSPVSLKPALVTETKRRFNFTKGLEIRPHSWRNCIEFDQNKEGRNLSLSPTHTSGLASQFQQRIFSSPALSQGSQRNRAGHHWVYQALPGATGGCAVLVFFIAP